MSKATRSYFDNKLKNIYLFLLKICLSKIKLNFTEHHIEIFFQNFKELVEYFYLIEISRIYLKKKEKRGERAV